jgi:hypothetical protein
MILDNIDYPSLLASKNAGERPSITFAVAKGKGLFI